MWSQKYSWCDINNIVDVMTQIQWPRCQIIWKNSLSVIIMKRVRIFIFWFHKDYQKGRYKVSIKKPFIHTLSDSSLCPFVSLPFSLAPFLYSVSSLPPSIPSFQIILFQCLISAGCYRYKGFLCGSAGKESACNVEDLGLIPGLERSPGEGKG